ncbi:MAG: GTP 3',8-cyclase MoaA [Oligoflexales bacterium]
MILIDEYGRQIRKLRVSLLDACNFRCFYCMPLNPQFTHPSKLLSSNEVVDICSQLVERGISQIRLTGGEPTLRKGFRDIVARLSQLAISKLGITSNGLLLAQHLEFLKDHRCYHMNISLDSLVREKFNKITRSESFDAVLKTIFEAKEMGFNLKINTVLMKGHNDDEIWDFVNFSASNDIEVRFLEAMNIGQIVSKKGSLFISAQSAIEKIEEKFELSPVVGTEQDSTSFNYSTKAGANIGFIASESKPFCGSCSRWRLSAKGMLRACLMSEKGVDLKDLLPAELEQKLNNLLKMKPINRIKEISQDMNQIGG